MQVGVTQGSEGNALDRQETTSPSTSLSVWPASVKMLGFFHFKLKMFLGPNLERLNVLLCTFFCLFLFCRHKDRTGENILTKRQTEKASKQDKHKITLDSTSKGIGARKGGFEVGGGGAGC